MSLRALREIVARSLSLHERIDLFRRAPSSFQRDDARAADLVARWQRALSRAGDPGALDRRLRFEGLDRDAAAVVLGRVVLPDDHPTPAWAEILGRVLEEMRAAPGAPARCSETAFVDYWVPWLRVAERRVEGWTALPEAVRRALVDALLVDLARSGTQCLMHEFDVERLEPQSGNDLFFGRLGSRGAPSTERYRAFVARAHGEGALALLEAYPCLARLAATQVEQWSRHVSELLRRLERDRGELEARLGVRGELVAVEPELSDPHAGGRRVVGLRFGGGARVVYKPKDLGTERAFQALVARLNAFGFAPPLKTLEIVARDGYGWVEHAEAAPCASEAELRDYYVRCGALLALVTLLHGSDCHFENLVACGDQPVLVDHEALLSPASSSAHASGSAREQMQRRLEVSVLRTGLLPEWSVELDGTVVDLSGIGARRGPRARSRLRLVHANTDRMALEATPDVIEEALDSVAHVEGRAPTPADDFDVEVREGFERAYRLLAANARALEDELAGLGHLTSRFVARSTVTYGHLLRESRRAALMTDGAIRSIALDRMAQMFLDGADERPAAWPLLAAEHAAIVRGDVPCLSLRADETSLFDRDVETGAVVRIAEAVFERSGLSAVLETARSLSEEELAVESRLVEHAFAGKAARSIPDEPDAEAVATGAPLDGGRALAAALAIAREIADAAIVYRGHRHHVGLVFDEASGTHQVALLGATTYAGSSGLALFLGATAFVARDEALRRAALDVLEPTRELLRADPRALVTEAGPGGFEGAGSLLYAFGELALWTEDGALVDDARLLARAITPADIDDAASSDVVSGIAGLVFGLASLRARVDGARATELTPILKRCGERLVETAIPQAHGVGWPPPGGARALAGMAHGGSGIAAALFECWRLGGPRELRDVALRALEHERALYDVAARGWPDLRRDGAGVMATWCSGAPGIALARSRMLAVDDVPELRRDLALALEATRSARLRAGHLCCGTAGLDEILFEVGRRTNDAALSELARRRASERLDRADRLGRWPHVVSHGLMRGSAGIGLGLLRMSGRAAAVPCVLDMSAA